MLCGTFPWSRQTTGWFWRHLPGLLHWAALVQLVALPPPVVSVMHGGVVRRAPAAESQSNSGWEEPLGASGPTPAQSTASLTGRGGCSRLVRLRFVGLQGWRVQPDQPQHCQGHRVQTSLTPRPHSSSSLPASQEMLGHHLLSVTPRWPSPPLCPRPWRWQSIAGLKHGAFGSQKEASGVLAIDHILSPGGTREHGSRLVVAFQHVGSCLYTWADAGKRKGLAG